MGVGVTIPNVRYIGGYTIIDPNLPTRRIQRCSCTNCRNPRFWGWICIKTRNNSSSWAHLGVVSSRSTGLQPNSPSPNPSKVSGLVYVDNAGYRVGWRIIWHFEISSSELQSLLGYLFIFTLYTVYSQFPPSKTLSLEAVVSYQTDPSSVVAGAVAETVTTGWT